MSPSFIFAILSISAVLHFVTYLVRDYGNFMTQDIRFASRVARSHTTWNTAGGQNSIVNNNQVIVN